MAKKISIGLSPRELSRAIRELDEFQDEFHRKLEKFTQRVAETMADHANRGFSAALLDDLLQGSSRSASVQVSVQHNHQVSLVIAKGEDAVWVEFGTGVYHNGSAGSSPHPRGSELGMTIGGYGAGRGKRKVWGYYEEGELTLTHGTPATMPMYRAATTVCAEISKIAREVFG